MVILEMEEPETRGWTEVASLVQRAQDRDRGAFGELIVQFQPTVYAIALRRLGNASEAAELTQEVFVHVLRRIHQLREPERFAGWLRQVAVRMAINRATRHLPPTTVEAGVLEGAIEAGDQPVDELITRERAEHLWQAMARLKTLDRESLVAFYIRGLSLVEIAAEMKVPLGTIKRRLHTARKRLRRELIAAAADANEWFDGGDPDADDHDADVDVESPYAMAGDAGRGW